MTGVQVARDNEPPNPDKLVFTSCIEGPRQVDGTIGDRPFYLHVKHGGWTLVVVEPGADPVTVSALGPRSAGRCWSGADAYGGDMPEYAAKSLITAILSTPVSTWPALGVQRRVEAFTGMNAADIEEVDYKAQPIWRLAEAAWTAIGGTLTLEINDPDWVRCVARKISGAWSEPGGSKFDTVVNNNPAFLLACALSLVAALEARSIQLTQPPTRPLWLLMTARLYVQGLQDKASELGWCIFIGGEVLYDGHGSVLDLVAKPRNGSPQVGELLELLPESGRTPSRVDFGYPVYTYMAGGLKVELTLWADSIKQP